MLIIPEHEGESVREFGQRLRLWNPQLDTASARRTAAKVIRGEYTRHFIKAVNAVRREHEDGE
jgi:hypothetical protein